MYQVVIDTNVIVAALRSRRGASHRLLRLVGDPRWNANLSVPLVLEYEQSMLRAVSSGSIGAMEVSNILEFLCASATLRPIFFLWRPFLSDPKDHMVLELAIESRADFLITFNIKDFRPARQFGIQVVTPAQFLAIMEATG